MATGTNAGSLSSAFNLKSLLHVGHSLMMISMAAAAISMVVSSGGAVGFLDPLTHFFDMFIPEMDHLAVIPDFISSAYDSAANGTWLTDNAFNLAADPHAAHLAHAAAETFTSEWDWFASISDVAREQMIADAQMFGMPLQEYIADWCAQQNIPGLS